MVTRIPAHRLGDRAARLGGVTLLAAAVGLASAAPSPPGAPVADRAVPREAPAQRPERPDIPAAAPVIAAPPPVAPQATPIDFTTSGGARGVPASVLAAYRRTAATIAVTQPGCWLRSELLAGIGRVESGHARGGRVDAAGTTLTPILGPVLSGEHGFAAIPDTDSGRLDGDRLWDRAVGPMQFIPGTWTRWAADGNGDGATNPHNVYDASLATGRYLCANHRDLRQPAELDAAILSYNRSGSYLRLVLAWMRAYALDVSAIPDSTSPLPIPTPTPRGTEPGPTPEVPPPPDDTPRPDEPAPSTTLPPPTSTPPATTPPPPTTAAPGPVGSVLCVVGGVLGAVVGGLGSLLGAPPPEDDVASDCPNSR